MDNTIGVALVYKACPVCGHKDDGQLIMNEVLSEKKAGEIEELDGKCIGYSDEPCKKCKEMMEKAFLFIIYDESKTTEETGPYRTGQLIGIKKDSDFLKNFTPESLSKGYAFIDIEFAKQVGSIQDEQ